MNAQQATEYSEAARFVARRLKGEPGTTDNIIWFELPSTVSFPVLNRIEDDLDAFADEVRRHQKATVTIKLQAKIKGDNVPDFGLGEGVVADCIVEYRETDDERIVAQAIAASCREFLDEIFEVVAVPCD